MVQQVLHMLRRAESEELQKVGERAGSCNSLQILFFSNSTRNLSVYLQQESVCARKVLGFQLV